ncbi:MAG: hypothetical protein HY331_04925, partial [Chloroflexi bacterium]|nr:hypothetical protein [Chloroflexota bacterium]
MRILTISAHYPPALSGVGDYTACLAAQLAEWGHEVTVLTGQTLTPGPSPAHGRGETSGARPVENQTSSFTPLPSRGRGAGGEGEPPAVPPLPSRGRGAGGEGEPPAVPPLPSRGRG